MTSTTIVTTAAVAAAAEGDFAIVDCRFDLHNENWGRLEYERAHVPGAVYASLATDLAAAPDGRNGRHPLPSIEEMAATFGRLGIDRTTPVVAYDQDSGIYAARLWWMLRYAGHTAVAVLDGGWAAWTREARATRAGVETRRPRTFVPAPRAAMRADLDTVLAIHHDGNARFIDARAPERFEGRTEPLDRVAGHIPGAANHFFKQNLTDAGTMKSPEQLRAEWQQTLAGRQPQEALLYCGSGVTACHNALAMEHAGLPGARLYVGSWSEWSSDPQRPVETGPAR